MASSGIPWNDNVFDWSVIALVECAKLLGITYEEINVWLFCVAWPLVTLVMVAVIVKLWRENQILKGQLGIQPVSQGCTCNVFF